MGRCGGASARSTCRCSGGAAMGCTWLQRCFRQQDLHFSAAGFENHDDKLSCKIARKHYLSTQESHLHSHRGACTHCLLLRHTV